MNTTQMTTGSTLLNAVELASKVVQQVAGNEVANTVDNKPQSGSDIRSAVAARINLELINKGVNA